jgi:hypothetical protein
MFDFSISIWTLALFVIACAVAFWVGHNVGYDSGRKDEELWQMKPVAEREQILKREAARAQHEAALDAQYEADRRAHYERTGDTDPMDFPPRRNTLGPRPS